MTRPQFQTARIAVLILYLVFATAYSLVSPAFESPDELLHFDYVESLLRARHLPIAEGELTEDFQAPLYYVTGALITAWLPPGLPASELIERNPFWAWRIGEVGVDNKSQFLHGPEQGFPWVGLWLRLHLLRFLSILLGLIAVWQTGKFALLLWPRRYDAALLATAFIAFLPQFIYLSSSVTNDIAVVALERAGRGGVGKALGFTLPEIARCAWRPLVGAALGPWGPVQDQYVGSVCRGPGRLGPISVRQQALDASPSVEQPGPGGAARGCHRHSLSGAKLAGLR